jgi:hypothetical protein
VSIWRGPEATPDLRVWTQNAFSCFVRLLLPAYRHSLTIAVDFYCQILTALIIIAKITSGLELYVQQQVDFCWRRL